MVWVAGADPAILAAFATEQAAIDHAEAMDGFSDEDAPLEVEGDGTWHGSMLDGSELIISPAEVEE